MHKILLQKLLGPQINLIEIDAAEIANKILPGQFVILRVHPKGERIPLTVTKKDLTRGTITIIFQEVGNTTKLLAKLHLGDEIHDLVGPLGSPTEINSINAIDTGKVVAIGGGVGIAELLPVVEAVKNGGREVIGIIGARTKELVILQNELRQVTDELYITTDDGSYGQKGFVTDILKNLISQSPHPPISMTYAVGPVPMMKKVSEVTRPYSIKTIVSLNPIMVDGTGMCGSCRVSVGGKTKFACVDGPEFDAHQVNWSELEARLKLFSTQENLISNV